MIDRRDFLKAVSAGAGALLLPPFYGRAIAAEALTSQLDVSLKKKLADVALGTAKKGGASYCDVRIGRYLRQFVITREDKVENVVNTESTGVGIRVIANGTWGFAATSDLSDSAVATAVAQAVSIAKANSKYQTTPVALAPTKGVGEVSWATPIEKNAMEVPIKEKVDLLIDVNKAALAAGANYIRTVLFAVNEQKYFASTDGSYIDQDIHRIWVPVEVTVVDQATGKFRTREGLSAPMGMGYEYLEPKKEGPHRAAGGAVAYSTSYDLREDAVAAAKQAKAKITARSGEAGQVRSRAGSIAPVAHDPRVVGHPTELDRVLGYEANYAGTSFVTLDKWQSKNFKYGSDKVTIFADNMQAGALGTRGYDDEGIKSERWDLIKDGVLVNYQVIRDQAHILGAKASQGCCYADSWSSVQFQRMPERLAGAGQGEARRRQR
jgi:TldD protein